MAAAYGGSQKERKALCVNRGGRPCDSSRERNAKHDLREREAGKPPQWDDAACQIGGKAVIRVRPDPTVPFGALQDGEERVAARHATSSPGAATFLLLRTAPPPGSKRCSRCSPLRESGS